MTGLGEFQQNVAYVRARDLASSVQRGVRAESSIVDALSFGLGPILSVLCASKGPRGRGRWPLRRAVND